MVVTVVVQQRARLFREGLGQLLGAEDDIEVVGTASSADQLVEVCGRESPGVVVMEANSSDWDASRLPARLRCLAPKLLVVGLTAADTSLSEVARAQRGGMAYLVSYAGGIAGVLAAVRAAGCQPRLRLARACSPPSRAGATTTLTERELGILTLVGAGFTSREISGRLTISQKTVENHKQRIFAKLGVQNQAHAVSIAMQTGLMRPDRFVGLALVH